MHSRKKIAIITPFLANGGLEKVAIVGAEELRKYYDVTLIVMDSYKIDYPFSGKILDLKVSLVARSSVKRLYNILSATFKLSKLKKVHDFDLVISHGELANLPNIFSGGKKNILVIHGNRFAEASIKDMQRKFVNKMIKYIYFSKNISKIVTVSEGIRESFIKVLGIKEQDIVTIYNPFDIDEIKILANEPLDDYSDLFSYPVLTTTGRLSMLKGQWYLLRIFKELKKTTPDLKLVILGDGEMKEKLIKISEELGLRTYTVWSENVFDTSYDVYFMGFQKNPFKFMHASKLFILTSFLEGFGNVLVEAMACAIPVISTDCQFGPAEIIYTKLKKNIIIDEPIYDGFGVLMPILKNKFVSADEVLDEREQLWVDALQSLLTDDKSLLDYTRNGLNRAEDFRLENIMIAWKDLIDKSLEHDNMKTQC